MCVLTANHSFEFLSVFLNEILNVDFLVCLSWKCSSKLCNNTRINVVFNLRFVNVISIWLLTSKIQMNLSSFLFKTKFLTKSNERSNTSTWTDQDQWNVHIFWNYKRWWFSIDWDKLTNLCLFEIFRCKSSRSQTYSNLDCLWMFLNAWSDGVSSWEYSW